MIVFSWKTHIGNNADHPNVPLPGAEGHISIGQAPVKGFTKVYNNTIYMYMQLFRDLCGLIGHDNGFPIMHCFGIPRCTQSMIA
mgnify:FL=1